MKTMILASLIGLVAMAPLPAATLPDLTPAREAELALSAAPAHLRAEASVYVMGNRGLLQVQKGSNGFSCMVQREGQILAPICFDAEGTRTTLLANMRKAEMQAAGKDAQDIRATLEAEYESGKLKAPQGPGIAYMLSPEFVRVDPKTGEARQVFPPHVMFYAPYKTNEDFGFAKDAMGKSEGPFVLRPGTPTAYVIVVPPEHHQH